MSGGALPMRWHGVGIVRRPGFTRRRACLSVGGFFRHAVPTRSLRGDRNDDRGGGPVPRPFADHAGSWSPPSVACPAPPGTRATASRPDVISFWPCWVCGCAAARRCWGFPVNAPSPGDRYPLSALRDTEPFRSLGATLFSRSRTPSVMNVILCSMVQGISYEARDITRQGQRLLFIA